MAARPKRQHAVSTAAAGYWRRRGLETTPDQTVLAPNAAVLLLAVLAAVGPGDVVLTRPCADWYLPQLRLLGRRPRLGPVPAECGGVPDSYALLETILRAREEGGDPRVVLLSVADDPTGTATPPELLREVCEVAAQQGLLIVSDESWRDTFFDPQDTVGISPVEMLDAGPAMPGAGEVVVLVDLGAAVLTRGHTAGMARFGESRYGRTLRTAVDQVLVGLGAGLDLPTRDAVAVALEEPAPLRDERDAEVRRHRVYAAALCQTLHEVGAVCRPPRLGRQLYADLEPLRSVLTPRRITTSATLEAELVRALGGPWVRGGHWFAESADMLRIRFSTALLAPTVGWRARPVVEAEASRRLKRLTSALSGREIMR